MAGSYTPKSGPYAGRTFRSKREYVNVKARDEGYKNTEEKRELRAEQKELDVQYTSTKKYKNTNIKIYTSDNLSDIIEYARRLPPNYAVSIIIQSEYTTGVSKGKISKTGYSTIVKSKRISLFNRQYNDGSLLKDIYDKLDQMSENEINIQSVVLWVYIPK